jgi:hypothetical protein
MKKGSFIFITSTLVVFDAFAANSFMAKRFNTVSSHNDVYPYILNNTQINTNKKTTSMNTGNTTSSPVYGKRNVVKRKTNARAAVNSDPQPDTNEIYERRVIQRPVQVRATNNIQPARINQNRNTKTVNVRASTNSRVVKASNTTTATTEKVSSKRCMADYRECMEMYCQREDTAYNRCYCSAKLAQIDSKYQNKIDDLLQQIVRLQYKTSATSEEIKEYWDQTIGSYTGTNPWLNIENALNIEWADTQSRIRGQNAFNTGHEYCVNNLRACYYMATNLRDAYKSEIARDCATYEKSLQKIQAAAESVIESYND